MIPSLTPSNKEAASPSDIYMRCAAVVAALNKELDWGLNTDEQRKYCTNLLPVLPKDCSDTQMRRIVRSFHHDHVIVEGLKARDINVEREWREWMRKVFLIFRHAGLESLSDSIVFNEDLFRVVWIEMLSSLIKYQYRSRFST